MKISKYSKMTFQELGDMLDEFDAPRKWLDLDPADLAQSIIIEGAELLEHFQWDNTLRKRENKIPEKNKEEIGYEASDILIYLLKFCREMDIDIVDSTLKKLEKVRKKYPSDYNNGILTQSNGDLHYEEYLRLKKKHRLKK